MRLFLVIKLSNFAYTGTNKPFQGQLVHRKTCSSYRRASELVKKLAKENLLVCSGLLNELFYQVSVALLHSPTINIPSDYLGWV